MNLHLDKIPIRTTCVGFSFLAHLLLLFPVWKLGSYNFDRPVNPLNAVMVELGPQTHEAGPEQKPPAKKTSDIVSVAKDANDTESHAKAGGVAAEVPLKSEQQRMAEPIIPAVTPVTSTDNAVAAMKGSGQEKVPLPVVSAKKPHLYEIQPPLRNAAEFLATAQEHLTYQISMYHLPVGTAELVAKSEQGEVKITLKVKSAPILSSVYPVDDLVEIRHIGGNFILTRIRQQEGDFRSDRGFTIMLRERKVFWIDRLANRSVNETIPNGEVTDIISGLYFLRNRPLQVSRTEMLHVYDSDTYSHLPVEVLRREQIQLPGFRKADTIVIKPILKTDGIFKRTGDVTIWLTDDEFRVPVKVETQIPLGKVTIELIAADTKGGANSGNATAKKLN